MRIWVKPDQLAKLNITVPEIIAAVNSQNAVNPAGKIGGRPTPPGQEFTYTVLRAGPARRPRMNLATSSCAPRQTARWCG